jgi:hypothetical protein
MAKRKRSAGSFIRKTSAATGLIPEKLMNGAVRGVAAVGAHIGCNHVSRLVPKLPAKTHGPILFLLGIAGECFVENPIGRSAAEGITTAGVIKMADEFTPDTIKEKIGMNGLGAATIQSTPDWAATAEAAEREALAIEQMNNQYSVEDYSNAELLNNQLKKVKVSL